MGIAVPRTWSTVKRAFEICAPRELSLNAHRYILRSTMPDANYMLDEQLEELRRTTENNTIEIIDDDVRTDREGLARAS